MQAKNRFRTDGSGRTSTLNCKERGCIRSLGMVSRPYYLGDEKAYIDRIAISEYAI